MYVESAKILPTMTIAKFNVRFLDVQWKESKYAPQHSPLEGQRNTHSLDQGYGTRPTQNALGRG